MSLLHIYKGIHRKAMWRLRCAQVPIIKTMPQVSRIPIPKETEKKIKRAFVKVLVDITSEREMASYVFDLLTPTERIMMAKRLAIAVLLVEELPYREIADRLKVSTATIGKVNLWLKTAGDGYRLAIGRIGGLNLLKFS